MSQGLRESLLSYQLSKTERDLATSSSTDSPPSPHDSARSRSPPLSSRSRPALRIRPHSSDERARERIRIQLMEERSDLSAHRIMKHVDPPGTPQSEEVQHQSLPSARTSTENKVTQSSPTELASAPLRRPDASTSPSISKEKPERPSWARTRSGGVWYRRNSKSQDSGSIRSAMSLLTKNDQDETSSISVTPMKPPPRPRRLEPSPTNHIVVEMPFGHHRDSIVTSESVSTDQQVEKRRRSSIDVKRIFSAPLAIIRRSNKEKLFRIPKTSPAPSRTSHSHVDATGHRPFLKRNLIEHNLDRVSSLLEAHTAPKAKIRLHSLTHKSISSTSSSDPIDSRQSWSRALTGTFHADKNKSVERIRDNTSSILNLRMGSTPGNSPTEKATYRVKRSPSAETEEFLKIDISIRGGTSYLASEARRISTPPLPGARPSGSQRGFFFDYVAPDPNACGEPGPSYQEHHKNGLEQDHLMFGSLGHGDLTTQTDVQRSPSRKVVHKNKTGDWYETQLADVDATSSQIDVTISSEQERQHHCKHECQARLTEMKRQQYEAQLDFNIPEHLPNSPLCPRNPKYWRVKEQKGSQFRGCWMHGFGEYTTVPGLWKP